MKAEGGHIRDGTGGLSIVCRSDGMSSVRDQHQTVFITDFAKLLQVRGLPGVVHGNHRLRFFRHMGAHLLWIYVIGILVNIRKYRPCPAVKRAVCGSGKGDGRGDHLIPRPHARRKAGHMQGRRSVADGNRVLRSCDTAQLFLQFPDLRPAGQIIAL